MAEVELCWQEVYNILSSKLLRNQIKVQTNILIRQVNIASSLLLQILLNLTTNAIDALIQDASEDRWIRLHVFNEEGYVFLEVSNPRPKDFRSKSERNL